MASASRTKGLVKVYLAKVTGLSPRPVHPAHRPAQEDPPHPQSPPQSRDIALLAEIDAAHGQLSRPATKEVPRRQYELHGDERFKAPQGHLQRPHLRPPQGASLPHGIPLAEQDPPRPHPHRRPPQARSTRTTRLRPSRHRPPGRPRRREGPLRPWASSTMSPGSSTSAPSPASPRSSCSPSSTTSSPPSPSPSWASTQTVSIWKPVSSPWSDSNTDRRLGGLVRGQPAEAPASTDVVT